MENTYHTELTEDEIRFCMRGIHELWANYGISNNELKFLVKLEKVIEMTETKDYLESMGLDWLTEGKNGEKESRP